MRIGFKVNPFFWLLALLIGWINSSSPVQIVLWVIVIFVSVVVHELGHAFVGLLFKQRVHIELTAFGGSTFREGPKLTAGKEFLLVLAGPIFGAMLALVSFLLLLSFPAIPLSVAFSLHITVLVNVLWTLLNLLPILPLDGGQLLRIVLQKLFGFRGVKSAHYISFVLCLVAGFAAFAVQQFFMGALFLLLSFASFRSLQSARLLKEEDQDFALQEKFERAEKNLLQGKKQEALKEFQEIYHTSHEGMIHSIATENVALALLEDPQKRKEAYRMLLALPKLSPELVAPFHALAYEQGDFNNTLKYAEEAYQLQPLAKTALINAMAFAQTRQAEPAIGWLHCAVTEGNLNWQDVTKKAEFDPIRDFLPKDV